MRPAEDGPRQRADHLECDGRRDRQRCCILQRPRLRRLARTGAKADRTILGKISRRGNRYLRSLFVQAAWVVLVRVGPKHWDRYGLKSWSRLPKNVRTTMCWRSRSPTSLPASPGRFSTRSANSSASGQTRCRPALLECRAVLGPVKAWSGDAGARGKANATASLDGPLRVARQHMRRPGRRNGPQARTKELHKDKERSMT